MANTGVGMRRGLWAGVGALLVFTACSGGSGSGAKATTSTTTSTTVATTTTTSPDDAVKTAWLGYWAMIDRLAAAPDPDDAELAQRAIDPILTDVRNDMATRKTQGRSTRPPANSRYAHHVQQVTVAGESADVRDCFIDDRVQFGPDGSVLNDEVATVRSTGKLVQNGSQWFVSSVQNEEIGNGDVGCGA